MSVTVTHIIQIIDLTCDINADKIVRKTMNNLLGRKDGINAHQFRLFVKSGNNYVGIEDSSISGKMFFRKPGGVEVEISGVLGTETVGTETVDLLKFSLPNSVYEQGAFRIDIRLDKASEERTFMIIEGNVM